MRRIQLDGRAMDSRDALYRHLREAFGFSEDTGKNLDALHDCLGELRGVQVTLRHKQAMLNSLGAYGQQLLTVFECSAASRDDFHFSSSD